MFNEPFNCFLTVILQNYIQCSKNTPFVDDGYQKVFAMLMLFCRDISLLVRSSLHCGSGIISQVIIGPVRMQINV